MNCFQALLQHSEQYHRRIKKICAPLAEHFGINWISFNKISADGSFIHLDNFPQVSEGYIEHQAYLCDPLLRDPRLLPKGIVLFDEMPSIEYKELVKEKISAFNIDLGMLIIEPNQNDVTIFAIGAPKLSTYQLSYYLNELPLIRQFFHYFENEAHAIIRQAQKSPVELLNIIQQNFYKKDFFSHINAPKQKFIQHISKVGENLSLREKQCLQALLHGYSAKQIAAKLDLSSRTVENYLSTLKQKFHCHSKSDLIAKARELAAFLIICQE